MSYIRHSERTEESGCEGIIGNTHPSGRGMNGNVYSDEGVAPALTTNKGEGIKIAHRKRE